MAAAVVVTTAVVAVAAITVAVPQAADPKTAAIKAAAAVLAADRPAWTTKSLSRKTGGFGPLFHAQRAVKLSRLNLVWVFPVTLA